MSCKDVPRVLEVAKKGLLDLGSVKMSQDLQGVSVALTIAYLPVQSAQPPSFSYLDKLFASMVCVCSFGT